MDIQELMRLETQKAIIKALAELEIALNTFHNNDSRYNSINYIYIYTNNLKNLKKDIYTK